MIDAGYYLLERQHGVPAIWNTTGGVLEYDTSTGEVLRDGEPHGIPKGLLVRDVISSFDRLSLSIANYGAPYDKNAMTFLIRESYLPPKYDLHKPNTNNILTIADLDYKIDGLSISGGIVFLKLSRA